MPRFDRSFLNMSQPSAPFFLPLAKGCSLAGVDPCGWVALNKPTGLLSVPNSEKDLNKSVLKAKFSKKDQAYVWFDKEQVKRHFYICHRLDSPTSGILLGSTDEDAADELKLMFKNRKIRKTYLAVIQGIPRKNQGQWKDNLQTKSESNGKQVRSTVKGSGDLCIAEWRVVKTDTRKRISLLELNPKTGRTHQLRVQCAHHLHPILGDRTYGDFKFNSRAKKEWGLQRLMLHASEVQIPQQRNAGALKWESAVPKEFFQLFDNS